MATTKESSHGPLGSCSAASHGLVDIDRQATGVSVLAELRVQIDTTSLSQTVAAINAAHFDGLPLTAAERGQAARWIAGRQGLPSAYGGTFAGFPSERSKGIVLFTGERVASASARHILGEEASRALRLLRVRDPNVTRALDAADAGLMRCLERAAQDPP